LLKFESNLICAPCHHGKMIVVSHSPVNTVMTEQPGQLLHLDTIGSSRVLSVEGKWYILSMWMIIHIIFMFSSWRARMKCLTLSYLSFEVQQ
jgi:hypothetical protein